MQTPVQVTFRGLDHSDALDTAIRERVDWLEQFYKGIVSGKVLVEVPHRHRHSGRAFHVRVTLAVPGRPPIVVSHEPGLVPVRTSNGHEDRPANDTVETGERDALMAVHRAFDAARRQLQEFARIERHDVKPHGRSGNGVSLDEDLPLQPALVETAYGLRVEIPAEYEHALSQTIEALKAQGFGVLTTIDVQQTLRQKLDRDFRKYAILGACHPALAARALHAELEVGLLLPCNVIVYEAEPGWSVISAVAPLAALGMVAEHAELRGVAEEADTRLRAALTALLAAYASR